MYLPILNVVRALLNTKAIEQTVGFSADTNIDLTNRCFKHVSERLKADFLNRSRSLLATSLC